MENISLVSKMMILHQRKNVTEFKLSIVISEGRGVLENLYNDIKI